MKRFRREVLQAGVVPEVRRRRYFENSVDMKKRKERESWKKLKRNKFPPRTYEQAMTQETSPFNDMFGTADDIFADVLSVGEGVSSSR
jgi:ribosomal protein S21